MIKIVIIYLSFHAILSTARGSIKFGPLINHTEEEKEIVQIAQDLSNQLIQSTCFNNFMMERDLRETNGKTNQEVIEHLKSADIQVPVKMYHNPASKAVGYRKPPSSTINTNRKFHAGASACSRGSNLTHETSHVLKYGHAYKAHKDRPLSVPYSINAAFKKCCACDGIRNCIILDEMVKTQTKIVCQRKWYFLWIGKKCYTKSL